ncbi:hypothetical protein F383_04550 [Gossypium arboreum]|uniref:Uncharacterized protein n=1 Tax=Gossypium arboreum TaxID=29729 RepID=A0A0B0MMD0_GOSAR|nr:hypothetical protein F383_39300 [Gossypium arboreum]KHG22196.1 hypothetical protein F383_04550 [Gossypium arboreum]
MPSGLSPDI